MQSRYDPHDHARTSCAYSLCIWQQFSQPTYKQESSTRRVSGTHMPSSLRTAQCRLSWTLCSKFRVEKSQVAGNF
eukprot:6207398-Pleurochrysis_carterae.AAC.1